MHSSRKKKKKKEDAIVHNYPKLWNPENAAQDVTLHDNSRKGKASAKHSISHIKGISLRYWTTVKSFIFPTGSQYLPFPFSCLGEWFCFHSEGQLLLSNKNKRSCVVERYPSLPWSTTMMKVQPGEQFYHVFQLPCVRTVSLCSALPSLLRLPITLLVNIHYLTHSNVMDGQSSELSHGHRKSYQVSTQLH